MPHQVVSRENPSIGTSWCNGANDERQPAERNNDQTRDRNT
jgi:hypothetical protein